MKQLNHPSSVQKQILNMQNYFTQTTLHISIV